MAIKVSYNRAILTAIAMLITGCILSSMSMSFFQSLHDVGLSRSRLWWEIVLNLQILCGALVWFSFVERIKSATGHIYYIRVAQFLVALVAVLLPALIGFAGIAMGWFEKRPDIASLNLLIIACLLLWWSGLALPIVVRRLLEGHWEIPPYVRFPGVMSFFVRLWPFLLVIALVLFEQWRGGLTHYIYSPFLLYLQGALTYVIRSVRLVRS
ncbi:hypothetical protein [Kordiimonas sp.]|uniref:hypothetical protein n=1 Tax=Kordiimonas sp. TaxID=1970157 RepID=UPI003A917169